MKKFVVFLIIITGSFVLPYYFHTEIYRFYLKFYYSRAYKGDEYIVKARKLYDEGKYAELKKFIEPLLFIYLEDNELKRIAGLTYIKLGEELKGAEMYTAGMDGGYNDFDAARVIKILFYKGSYSDVLSYYNRRILVRNMDISYYYGVSLLMRDRADEAIDMLLSAEKSGYNDRQNLYYYTGLALEKKKKDREAAEYLLKAYNAGPADDKITEALARVYGKTGIYDRAEILVRKKKN